MTTEMVAVSRGGTIVAVPYSTQLDPNEFMWGTYGKPAQLPLRWVRLVDCSSEHLQAILDTQPIHDIYRTTIESILIQRNQSDEHRL